MRVHEYENSLVMLSGNHYKNMAIIKSYVPILRWRLAEMKAVERLYPKDREDITPLIEFMMPPPTTDKKDYKKILEDSKSKFLRKLPDIAQQLVQYCGKSTVFIDVHLLDGDIRTSAFEKILSSANALDLFSIPVIHVIPVTSTNADMITRQIAVKYSKINDSGLCIRIDGSHLNDKDLPRHIGNFIAENGLSIKNTDILVDLQIIDKDTIAKSVIKKLSHLPDINKWRSFIISGGAFPKDLTDFLKHGHYKLERLDWNLWQNIINDETLKRQPIFSDYTIQHPIHYGHIPGANTSASIRYTNDEKWEIIRGEGLRNKKGAGHKQYPAHAQLIVQQSFFKGANYSFGDTYIVERASPGNKNNGNPTTWLIAGINHHLTLVARQIANLS